MIQLNILSGKKAGTEWVTRRFPFWVGRSPQAELQIDEPGVWDKHFQISLEEKSFVATATPSAFLIVNGEKCERATLKNGDLMEIGLLKIRFAIAPSKQRSLIPREVSTWLALALLCAAQIAIVYWLIR